MNLFRSRPPDLFRSRSQDLFWSQELYFLEGAVIWAGDDDSSLGAAPRCGGRRPDGRRDGADLPRPIIVDQHARFLNAAIGPRHLLDSWPVAFAAPMVSPGVDYRNIQVPDPARIAHQNVRVLGAPIF